jgi:uncharacterized protein HemX
MLGKILLTLTVIGIAYLVIRQRQVAEAAAPTKAKDKSKASAKQSPPNTSPSATRSEGNLAAEQPGFSQDLRIASYLFLVFMVGIGAALYYYRWQDDHQVITVNLHRADQDTPVSYQVYKFQLRDRTFTTVDGRQVTVASSERMEIIGLND